MADVFISYARGDADMAERVAAALRAIDYGVWRDDQLPVHRAYSEVIEERLNAADAILVLWSKEAARSQWVRAEAEVGRQGAKLAQATLDGELPPIPFNQIQSADISGWSGEAEHAGWRKVVSSVAALAGAPIAGAEHRTPKGAGRPSIAALPLQNLTGGRDEGAFADGIVDEIVTALARFPILYVVGARSGESYRNDPRAAAEIAAELGVRFILSGTVRRAADRVRIALNLTEAPSGRQLWAQRFEGRLDQAFELQDQIATAATGQLTSAIEASYVAQVLTRPVAELSPYELYLRAAYLLRSFTRENFAEGIVALDLAIERDPNLVLALSYCSLLHALTLLNGWSDDPAGTARLSLELSRRALALGVDDPDALARISSVLLWVDHDTKAADSLAERAIALNPNASQPWFASAWIQISLGQHEQAIERFERHLALDPRSPLYAFATGGIGMALTLSGHPEQGAARLGEARRHVPDQRPFGVFHAAALARIGCIAEAKAAVEGFPMAAIENALGILQVDKDRQLIAESLKHLG